MFHPPRSARAGDPGPLRNQISLHENVKLDTQIVRGRVEVFEKFGVSMGPGPPSGGFRGGQTPPPPHKSISYKLSFSIHFDKCTTILTKYSLYINYNQVFKM